MLIIVIDQGDTFLGNLDQFKNCFFRNATKETILNWCKQLKMAVDFYDIPYDGWSQWCQGYIEARKRLPGK